MKILLTNDDGYTAEGINTLFNSLKKAGHDVFLVAPDRDRSAVSHGLTMLEPVTISEKGDHLYACSGTPVDCVINAHHALFGKQPVDVVISGINRGENLGTDILFSGTVAAARQAVMYSVPGIAVSLHQGADGSYHYTALAQFVVANLSHLISLCKKDVLVNINARSAQSYGAVVFADVCRRIYTDERKITTTDDDQTMLTFADGLVSTDPHGTSDWDVVMNGDIALSTVYAQPVNVTPESTDISFILPTQGDISGCF